ncbi:MAG: hypothetical protein ACR5K9_04285 [Wolbachia sp.]
MALTNYKYGKGDSVLHAISEGYKQAKDYWGIPGAVGGLGEYAKNNKWKTAAVAGIVIAVPLIAAYFLSPAYAGFVSTTAGSACAGMIAGGKGLYALAATNPVFTGLLAAAIVGTIGALIYMNYSKASQIDGVKKEFDGLYTKNGDKLELQKGGDDLKTSLYNIAVQLGVIPVKTVQ